MDKSMIAEGHGYRQGAAVGLDERSKWFRRVLMLSWFTIAYNLVEGVVSVYFGLEGSSVSLAAFGLDSFVEVASASVILWRFRGEGEHGRRGMKSKEREVLALRAIGILFFVLSIGTAIGAIARLLGHQHPETTLPGIVVSLLSLSFMYSLYRAKLQAGQALESRSVLSDAACSKACIQLSVVLLAGSALFWLSPALHWVDSAAALGIAFLIAREGAETMKDSTQEGGCCGCGG